MIGQEAAKRAVAIAAYNHLKRVDARKMRRGSLLKKANVLLIGPTGSGKTHIARNLAEILSVPFTIVDATEYTEAGYYGKDVEVMVADLLLKANHSVEDAERGIIFIDEVDKIARRSPRARATAPAAATSAARACSRRCSSCSRAARSSCRSTSPSTGTSTTSSR